MSPTTAPTTSAQALQNLQSYQSSEKSPTDLLNSQEQQLGVPQAQQQVSGLRQAIQNTTNVLNNVAPSTYGRTQNSLVTDSQANAQIQNQEAPLNSQLDTENTQYGNAENDANNALSQASTLAQLEEQGQTGQEGYLQNIYSDLSASEQQQAAQALAQQQLAEQAREANLTASNAASSAVASPTLASILGTLGLGGSQANASYGLKVANNPASGFYFRDANGNPINALQYATATGTSLAAVVSQMAKAGDTGAKEVLPFVSGNTIKAGVLNPTLIKDFTG